MEKGGLEEPLPRTRSQVYETCPNPNPPTRAVSLPELPARSSTRTIVIQHAARGCISQVPTSQGREAPGARLRKGLPGLVLKVSRRATKRQNRPVKRSALQAEETGRDSAKPFEPPRPPQTAERPQPHNPTLLTAAVRSSRKVRGSSRERRRGDVLARGAAGIGGARRALAPFWRPGHIGGACPVSGARPGGPRSRCWALTRPLLLLSSRYRPT